MGTEDYTGGSSVGSVIPTKGLGMMYTREVQIDFSDTNADASTVVQALDIPAGTQVFNVWLEIVTAEGGTLTCTVGDGDGADSFEGEADLNATAGTVTYGAGGTDAYVTAGGKFYSSADTIDLTLSANAADTAVVNVIALCADIIGQV